MTNLRLGDTAPDFTQYSTAGKISFHQWAADSWVVLFSHPAGFTPVCTTELGKTAALGSEFARRNVKPIATFTYPASTGRNFDEILRVIDSLQLTDSHKVATPVNWKDGDDVVIVPSIQNPAELAQRFPKGFNAVRPYLRITPQPNK